MSTVMRWQVSTYKSSDLPRDWITNTFYLHQTTPDLIIDTEWGSMAEDIANMWSAFRPWPAGWNRILVKGYDMADSQPRRPKATHGITNANTGSADNGPREVACCLSFSTEKNTPRERGRLYIGPWPGSQMDERPGATVRGYLQTLAQGLQDLGGVDIDWSIHSETGTPTTVAVERWWVDDEWDTQRRRGLAATTRTQGTTSENSP